jgi:tetratricopeptide (TPR) repeat protein
LGQTKACCEQTLTIYQTVGDRPGEAYALGNLAQMYHALGDLVTAREYHERSLSLHQAVANRGGQALTLENLALVLHDLGDNRTAQQHCKRALAIEREIGDRQGEGYCLSYLALALEELDELEEATVAYQDALRLRREIGQDALAIDDLAGLARIALKQGQIEKALEHAEGTMKWITEQGIDGIDYPLRVYLTAAEVLAAAGQPERACEILATSDSLVQERADHISDEITRDAFLENVPLHRQLCECIAAQSG